MEEITSYFAQLGYNQKESEIFVTLWQLGSKPASTIASVCGYERVYTYKVLQKFVNDGIVAETLSKGVKHFWIPSLDLLKHHVSKYQQKYLALDQQFVYIQTLLHNLHKHDQTSIPRIQLFEQHKGIQLLFEDIWTEIQQQNLIVIKFFGMNTFETQMLSSHTLIDYAQHFATQIQKQSITIQSYIADGSLMMEHINYQEHIGTLIDLPAGNDAINIFVVGKVIYLIIHKNQAIGIKISSPELAGVMHFILEQTVRS